MGRPERDATPPIHSAIADPDRLCDGRTSTVNRSHRRAFAARSSPSPSHSYRKCYLERLENRCLLTHGPLIHPDGSVEITLDDAFDQFGFQPAIFQAYDTSPENGFDDGLAGFSIFDTGASVVTFGAEDQVVFSLLGAGGIPVQVECGAVAEAVGGLSLVGHISQRGTVLADGLHVSTLTFDEEGFPLFQLGFQDPEFGTIADPLFGDDDISGDAGLSGLDDHYQGFYLSFTSGALRGEVREISDYIGQSHRFSFRSPFSLEPAIGDRFVLIAPQVPFVSETATGTVVDSSPAADRFSADAALTAQEGFYLQFTSGALRGQMQQITDYVAATRTLHFSAPYSSPPANGDAFRILQINTTPAAIAHGVQAFVGTHVAVPPEGCPDPASPTLPTIAGTPMLSPTAGHPNGLAVNIRPFGAFLDFSGFAGFEQFVIPVPDVQFQEPGQGIPHDPACLVTDGQAFRSICTETPMRIPLEFLGNMVDQDGQLTEAYNPVHHHVTAAHRRSDTGAVVELADQTFLFDTGAQLSVISPAAANAFGLDLNSPEDTISVQTAGGVIADLPGYRINSITVPMEGGTTLTFHNVWVFVVDAAPGLLDGILGMNLFNLAAAMVYDPWHPLGPVLELQYFTEHLFDFGFAEVPEIEPNDVPADATPLRPGEYGVGALSGTDVVDYWAAPGAREGDLIFAYVDTQQSTSSKDAVLTVLDKNEKMLASDDNDGPGASPVVAGVPVSTGLAGTLYYQVREATGGAISEYAIYSAILDPSDAADEGETGAGANDSATTATPISRTLMTGSLGNTSGSGDVDFYEVLATEGARLVVMMDNDPDKNGTFTSSQISILDPNGNQIFPPTNGDGDGNATAAGAIVNASLSGKYFVKIGEGTSGSDNDYRFVALILDGGSALLAANLVQTAEAKRNAAEQVIREFEAALAACGADLFCQADVLTQYYDAILKATEEMAQAEVALAFASTITPGSMPTFVDIGDDRDEIVTAVHLAGNDLVVAASDSNRGANDTLTLAIGNAQLIITDLNHPLASSISGAVGSGTKELKVPLSAFSGGIIVELKDGDDSLVWDASLPVALASAMNFRAGAGERDTLLVQGSGYALDARQSTGLDVMNISGSGPNSLTVTRDGASQNLNGASDSLRIVSDADDQIILSGSWTLTGTLVQDNIFFRILRQADVTVHLAGPRDWQNPIDPHDINADSFVVPGDVLLVINQLNNPTFLGPGGRLVDAATVSAFPLRFFDADGNGFGTPLDALRIINVLNNRTLPEGERDGSFISGARVGPLVLLISADPQFQRGTSRNPTGDRFRTEMLHFAHRVTDADVKPATSDISAESVPRINRLALDEWLVTDALDRLIDELARSIEIRTEEILGSW